MVVDHRNGSDRFLVFLPLLPDQAVTEQIPNRFRPRRVLLAGNQDIKVVEQVMIERDAESNQFLHAPPRWYYDCDNRATPEIVVARSRESRQHW